jgi:hypothetical protein
MNHITRITLLKANTSEGEKQDAFGILFLQLWFTVMTWMLAGAFGKY